MTARATWLILILAAAALRVPDMGNPLVDLDEQMYLLVGQRMWQGAIPYVAYQLAALAVAVVTAGLIASFVRRLGRPAGGLAAGLLYLLWLELLGGRGGQSPVFYNGLVVAAAALTWRGRDGDRRYAIGAMLLVGLAMQIKPTVVFEGGFFGIVLLAASWNRRRSWPRTAGDTLLYGAIACLPTLVAYAVYAAIGHGAAWWFANVESIFLRRTTPGDPIVGHLLGSAILLLVPVAIACRGQAAATGEMRRFVAGWLVVATLGWLLVPPYFNHYALPLLVPVAVAAGLALDRGPMRLLAAGGGAGLLLLSGYPHVGETVRDRRTIAALAAVIDRERGDGCPFVFGAPPALYNATRACLPTRYPFPPHLVQASEYRAIGVDPAREVVRILAAPPPVIVIGPPPTDDNGVTPKLVEHAIATRYRAIARAPGVTVYVRTGRPEGND